MTSSFSCSIVRTGDTTKYLDFNSAEVVHVHHCTHSTQTILYTLEVLRKRRVMRRDLSKAFSPHCRPNTFHLHSSTTTCQARASPCNLIDQARAHIGNGCTVKQSSLEVLQSPLFLGGHPQVNIPQVKPLGTTLNSNILLSKPTPHRCLIIT